MKITIADEGSVRYVTLRGPLRDFLIRHKVPAMHNNRTRGWALRRERLADVLALAEAEGHQVRMIGGDR
ncbi:hypothetical protein [Segeticoccus rhizosphaerae]|uniref:hypothetical protein n=1 Tax=Segeticoccus rhizosphaerae TaxID=1104777 RepID=UPI0010BF8C7E|nr:hypothetical protein [Ornithinicoccus soli]